MNASSYSFRDSCKNEANKLLALYREKRGNLFKILEIKI